MRAAKEQERDCFVFAFAGPAEVRWLTPGACMPLQHLVACREDMWRAAACQRSPFQTYSHPCAPLHTLSFPLDFSSSLLLLLFPHLPQVREVELSMDMASILRLLDFLEALFNGGSDFNEPLKRCLNRLTDAKWANSDILLVSGVCRQRTTCDCKGQRSARQSCMI
jgi:hypothetical protein